MYVFFLDSSNPISVQTENTYHCCIVDITRFNLKSLKCSKSPEKLEVGISIRLQTGIHVLTMMWQADSIYLIFLPIHPIEIRFSKHWQLKQIFSKS